MSQNIGEAYIKRRFRSLNEVDVRIILKVVGLIGADLDRKTSVVPFRFYEGFHGALPI